MRKGRNIFYSVSAEPGLFLFQICEDILFLLTERTLLLDFQTFPICFAQMATWSSLGTISGRNGARQ